MGGCFSGAAGRPQPKPWTEDGGNGLQPAVILVPGEAADSGDPSSDGVPVVVEVPGKPGRWRRIRWRRAPLPADGKPASRGPRLRRGWLRRRRAPGGSTVAEVDGKGDDDKILVVVIEDDHMSRTSGSTVDFEWFDAQEDFIATPNGSLNGDGTAYQATVMDGEYYFEEGVDGDEALQGSVRLSPSKAGASPLTNEALNQKTPSHPQATMSHTLRDFIRSLSNPLQDDEASANWSSDPGLPVELRRQGGSMPFNAEVSGREECWSEPDPTSFFVRGGSYLKDKIKVPSQTSIYQCVGVDVFTTDKKCWHIARHLLLPEGPLMGPPGAGSQLLGQLPLYLIVNIQVPMYPPSFFGESDGVSQNVVLYYQLKDHGAHVAPQVLGLLQRFFADGTEENGDRTRERLKYIPRIANLPEAADELKISRPERNLMKTYDGKPVMTRPQHRFYQGQIQGKRYFEIDIDSHTYNFVARKGLHTFRTYLMSMIFDCALTIQGNSPEQLQEQILCCSRLYYFDFGRERRLLSSNAGGEPAGPQGQSDRQSDIGIRRDGEDREAGAARP